MPNAPSFGRSALNPNKSIFLKWGRLSTGGPVMPRLLVGLGNPGYSGTRHNLGSDFVVSLSKMVGLDFKQQPDINCSICVLNDPAKTILMTPLTYMNNSGIAVKNCLDFFKLNYRAIALVHDCLEIDVGKYKIRPHGSFKGHHGLLNVSKHLGQKFLHRLSIGIGRPENPKDVVDYVLDQIPAEEEDFIKQSVFYDVGKEFLEEIFKK